ncbi:MAG: hypothetical protein RLZZ618_1050 [Pseudomonadota bacterium]|jgi:hypothetical protein
MGVVLDGLKPLYREMRERRLTRVRFSYVHGRVVFAVYLFIDESPFMLLFGAHAHNVAFEVAVRQGFEADTRIAPAQYKALCEALGLHYDPANPFSPRAFLIAFGREIPAKLPPDSAPRPHELVQLRSDVEIKDGKYFCGWRDNNVRGDRVSEKNLYKTQRILGEAAFAVCARKNISSCWTDDPDRAIGVVIPQ